LKAKESKLTEEEAEGKLLMQKERNNLALNIDSIINSDIDSLEDGILNNDKHIAELKRTIKLCEIQNKLMVYQMKLMNSTNTHSLNDLYDEIDVLRLEMRRRDRLANSH